MKIRPVGAELFHADGQTKLIVTFRNFANQKLKRRAHASTLARPSNVAKSFLNKIGNVRVTQRSRYHCRREKICITYSECTSVALVTQHVNGHDNIILSSAACLVLRWCRWLRHCATSRQVAGSIPDGVTVIFH